MAPEWVRAWKPAVPGVHEVFHARFVDYAYPPHVHDTWTVFVVDDGWIRYDLETRHRGAGGRRVFLLPPHVVHDGRPADAGGFRKRVLYIGTDVLDQRLAGRAVDRPDSHDPALHRAVHALHRALREPDDCLEAEARLAVVGERLRAHLGDQPAEAASRPPGRLARELRDLLDGEPIAMVAAGVGFFDQAHFTRQFTRHVGVPPGRYAASARRPTP
jgi:AraC-like ligand binding domain/Helix-turn-helix domain